MKSIKQVETLSTERNTGSIRTDGKDTRVEEKTKETDNLFLVVSLKSDDMEFTVS